MEEDNIYEYEGKSYSESALREAYPDTFDDYVSEGILLKKESEEVVEDEIQQDTEAEVVGSVYEYDGNLYGENALREAYPDTFDDYVSQGILVKKDEPKVDVEEASFTAFKSQEENTLIEEMFGKNVITNAIGDTYRAINAGLAQSDAVDPTMDLMIAGDDATDKQLYEYIRINKELAKNQKIQDEMVAWDKAVDENGGGAYGILMATIENPGIAVPLMASSLATMVGSLQSEEVIAATIAGAGASAAVTGGIGAAATAATGGIAAPVAVGATALAALRGGQAALQATMEATLTFNELLQEEIEGELTFENVKAVLSDPEKLSELRTKAIARGAIIGAVDYITFGIANKFTGSALKAVKKGKSVASRAAIKTGAVVGGTAIEGAGGGAGEAAARFAIGQEMDIKEIALETIGEFGGAITSVGPAAYNNLKVVSGRVQANKTAKDGGYKNASSVFAPDTSIDQATIDLASNKNTSSIVDEQVEIEVANGRMTQEEADTIKENFRATQGAVNTANKIGRLSKENKPEVVNLLMEEKKLKDKIKDVDNASLTKIESNRLKEVQSRLEEIGNIEEESTSIEIDVTDSEYKDFVDNGNVTDERLNSLAQKVKDNTELTEKEQAIFNDKTSEVEEILKTFTEPVVEEASEVPAEVTKLRAEEQAEMLEQVPGAENALTDGKVDKEKLTTEEGKTKFQEIYDRYNDKISPLLETAPVEEVSEATKKPKATKTTKPKPTKTTKAKPTVETKSKTKSQVESKTKEIADVVAQRKKEREKYKKDSDKNFDEREKIKDDKNLSKEEKQKKIKALEAKRDKIKNSYEKKNNELGDKKNKLEKERESLEKKYKKESKSEESKRSQEVDNSEVNSETIKNKIRGQIKNAIKALSEIAKGVTIEVYETQKEYEASGGDPTDGGEYLPSTKTIKINLEKANLRTVAHEVFHAILLKDGITNKEAQRITSDMLDAVRRIASPKLLKRLDAFASNYNNGLQSEESISELFGILAENYETSSPVKKLINEWLRKLAKVLNIPIKGMLDSDKDIIEFLSVVSQKVASGEVIEQADIDILQSTAPIGNPTIINKPSLEKRKQIDFKESYKMSLVTSKDKIDLISLIDDIIKKNQKVWFWVADQLGLGEYEGVQMDAGPSFALQPENRKKKAIWASGLDDVKLNKNIKEADFIFIISGSPIVSKLFNKKVFDIYKKKLGDYESFKEKALATNPVKGIKETLEEFDSWADMRKSTRRKAFLIAVNEQFKKPNTKFHKLVQELGGFVDLNELRDGFYKENNFSQNDIMLVLKPTKLGGKSKHSTYSTDILGELVGVPDIKMNAEEIMPTDIKEKISGKGISEKTSSIAPYGGAVPSAVKNITAPETRKQKVEKAAITVEKIIDKVEKINKENPYINCEGFCNKIIGNKSFKEEFNKQPDIFRQGEDLYKQNDKINEVESILNPGDIIAFGDRSTPRHFAIYLTDGEMYEVEEWGAKPTKTTLKKVINEYESISDVYRDVETTEEPETRQQRTTRLAPNGNQSNLTDVQYDTVRTPAFKNWFGDWENDPKNASKVVDENGEPLVVYHGGPIIKGDSFRKGYADGNLRGDKGIYFTENKEFAKYFAHQNELVERDKRNFEYDDIPESELETGEPFNEKHFKYSEIYPVFLNLKKPTISETGNANLIPRLYEEGADGFITKSTSDFGYDAGQYIAFEPNQIKLADGTNTTFDPDAPSIRQQKATPLTDELIGLNESEIIKQGYLEFFNSMKDRAEDADFIYSEFVEEALDRMQSKINRIRETFKNKISRNKEARKEVRKQIAEILKNSGLDSISKRAIKSIMKNIENATPATMQKKVAEVMDVISRDIKRQARYNRKKTLGKALSNIGKIGSLKELNNILVDALKINPQYLSDKTLVKYDKIISSLASVSKKFDMPSRIELKSLAEAVITSFQADYKLAQEIIRDRINNNLDPSKSVLENLNQMKKENKITDSEFELLVRFKDQINETKKENVSAEDKAKTAQERRSEATEDFEAAIQGIPKSFKDLNDDERSVLRIVKTLTLKDLENLTTNEIQKLVRGLEGLMAGYIGSDLIQSVDTIKADRLSKNTATGEILERGFIDKLLTRAKTTIMNIFRARDKQVTPIMERIRSTPLKNIDQILNDAAKGFKSTKIYENVFRPTGVAFEAASKKLKMAKKDLDRAGAFLDISRNKRYAQKVKIMIYQIQREYDSNGGKKANAELVTAISMINHTLKDPLVDLSDRERAAIEKIRDEYLSIDGEIDADKIFNSFTDKEKKSLALIDKVYSDIQEMARMDAARQGLPFVLRKNYVHLPRITKGQNTMTSEEEFEALADNFANPVSMKSKALFQRNGKPHSISFDPIYNANAISRKATVSYYMVPAVKIGKRVLANLKANAKTDYQKDLFNSLEEVYDSIIRSEYKNVTKDRAFIEKALSFLGRSGYLAQLAGPIKAAVELASNATHAILYNPIAFNEGFQVLSKVSKDTINKALNNVYSTQTARLTENEGGSKDIEERLYASAPLFQQEQMTSDFGDRIGKVFSVLKKPAKAFMKFNEDLITKPDSLVAKPLFIGAFSASFEESTGQKPNWEKIANDENYRNKFDSAIQKASEDGDAAVIDNAASNNPFDAIPKNILDRDASAIKQALQTVNRYMSRFRTFEYYSALKGVQSMIGKGDLTKSQGALLLTATVIRMSMYKMAIDMAFSVVFSLLGLDDEDDEKEIDEEVSKGVLGAIATLALGRYLGNVAQMPVNYGAEWLNREYGEGITFSGDYNAYKDGIVFSKIPMEVKPQDNMISNVVINSLGSYTPMVKTVDRAGKLITRATASKRQETRDRNLDELLTRIPFEIAGNSGVIPGYKTLRKIYNKYLFGAGKNAATSKPNKTSSFTGPKLNKSTVPKLNKSKVPKLNKSTVPKLNK